MIDFKAFFRYLWRFKLLILLVVGATAAGSYLLVKNLPNKYRSLAQLSAQTGVAAEYLSQNQERMNMWQQLNRVVAMMKSRREIDALSYRLIIHDMLEPQSAFRPESDVLAKLSDSAKVAVLREYETKLKNRAVLTNEDNKTYPLWDIVVSMGYDNKSLLDGLALTMREEIGYIEVQFESENPDLSAYVVNTLSTQFMHEFNSILKSHSQESIAVLDSILRDKEGVMNEKNAILAHYRSATGTGGGAASSQSAVLFQQIVAFETQESEVRRKIASLKGTIASITAKLNDPDNTDLAVQASVANNNEIIQLERLLAEANRRYVDNGFRPQDKAVVDSLQQVRSTKVSAAPRAVGGTTSVTANRQKLISDRIQLETELALAENSVSSIQGQISALRQRYQAQMPADAGIQTVLRDADLATKEYTDALDNYNRATNERLAGLQLNIVEMGLPGLPEPSKKAIYLALSIMTSIFLTVSILLMVFLLDRSIRDRDALVQVTGTPVVGAVNLISGQQRDLREIWGADSEHAEYNFYKDLMRSLRFEIANRLAEGNDKVVGLTSLADGEGKTFLAVGLAYAFARMRKKVLLIGDDYPDLTEIISSKKADKQQSFETFLVKKEIKTEDFITVLNKNPNKRSLVEMQDAENLIPAFEILKKEFDIIIIDVNSLNDTNLAKEWLVFADKTFAVFSSGSSITGKDKEFLTYLKKQKSFQGWIFNKVRAV